jgi:D-xylose transport system substrate-binding protein
MTTKSLARLIATASVAALALTACATNRSAPSGSGSGSGGSSSLDGAKVAFLMPDQASTRYEQHDRPGYESKIKELCATCQVLYNNADGDAAKQQQQFNSALTQGAKVIVLDPVDSAAAAGLVQTAHAQGVKVIAYDRPIPTTPADFYVSYDNEKIGALISQSLVDHLKKTGVNTATGGLLEVNGSPTDAAAGLIKKGIHTGIATGSYKTLAEYDTPQWDPAQAQSWVSGQISRFGSQIVGVVAANDGTGGGAIAAFKAAGTTPVPPVTGNDATQAGLQLIISGDQFNTISKPSEVVAGAAAEASVSFLKNQTPQSQTTLFDTPSQLFVPVVITKDNIKAEIFAKGIAKASDICTGVYTAPCTALGIS